MTERPPAAHDPHDPPTGAAPHIDHEIDIHAIRRIGAWLTVVTVASFLVAWGIYEWLAHGEKKLDLRPSPIAEANRPRVPPGPQLQARPEAELAKLRAADQARLTSWEWLDRQTGLARVPVERAIDAVAASGKLPDFAPPAPAEVVAP